ncbi:Hint domain-containing protein [Paraliomyxa miuraensis]|uniref:Hint domain-containing protein n=1 Tax=Paraliomyxa miuraensis TaxID=376150 RepID=UPI002259BFFE|nr:Hint domain-containing protein [Paraliomyxa miuraensis]MCX4240045.1 Hint domain-containing protein [Paraliomyxa miuraensis]
MKHVVSILLPFLAIGTACGTKSDEPGPGSSSDTYNSYCIAAGTRVHTPDGTCPIESLEEGSVVLAVDPVSGEARPTRVVAVRSAERECLRLRLPGDEALVCTGDHPLYDPDANEYAPATDWVDGRRRHVAMLVDGRLRPVAVEGHDRYVGVRRVYDVSVEGQPHNFVASGCLVHNKSVFYCDTSYAYDDQGNCVMLSSTGIGDATYGETDTDGGTSGSGTADGRWLDHR